MYTSIAGIVIFSIFIVLLHQGTYPSSSVASRNPAREALEIALLLVCLLGIPFIEFDLLWFSGWRGAYLLFGLLAPIIMELLWRRRSLAAIGFCAPRDKRALIIVGVILGVYCAVRIIVPLAKGTEIHIEWQQLIANSIIFALLEETLFRGMIQTRLQSILGDGRAWVFSGLIFGAYHYYVHYLVPGQFLTFANALSLVSLTALGMLLGVVFAKTRSILPSFLIHAIHNLSL